MTEPVGARPIFGIFEGGGAKGIAHVGAYAAAHEMGLEFVGVAGASAGSIVAALIAVGFSPSEIFDPQLQGGDVFSAHRLSPIAVLGEREWRVFQRWRRYWRPLLCFALGVFAGTLIFAMIGWRAQARYFAIASMVLAVGASIRSGLLLQRRGFFDPAQFARVFNQILQQRVKATYEKAGRTGAQIPHAIRFRDIDPQQVSKFCRLKVVATDISGQQLRLFDHRTPDVVVAEAVAASIAIPGVFTPASIPSYRGSGSEPAGSPCYADGGLVSNLPVWCFSEEKAATERRTGNNAAVPIVAFTLQDGKAAPEHRAARSSFAYFLQVLRTGIFGGQTIVQEFVSDLYEIQLHCRLKVLAFDASRGDAKKAHDEAKQQASLRLRQRLVNEPKEWTMLLNTVCLDVERAIRLLPQSDSVPSLHLRAAVFEPIRSPRGRAAATFVTAYRATQSFNMDDDPDDRITLDAECPGVPEAFEQRSLTLWSPAKNAYRQAVMTKYERALVRRSIKTAICVPIFWAAGDWNLAPSARSEPLAVVALDTDEDIIGLLQSAPSVLASITEATFGLAPLLTERPVE